MNKKIVLITASVLALIFASCGLPIRYTQVRGNGELAEESRKVSGFNRVELSGIGTLIIEQGESESLVISAEKNILKFLESRVRGSTLFLGTQDFVNLQPTEDITYRLSVTDLRDIETSGLGNVNLDSLETDQLTVRISGSGEVFIKSLVADTFDARISGLGMVEIAGEVGDQRIEISGAGDYVAGDLSSLNARVEISGTGDALLWVQEKIDVDISGAGSVRYYGSPVLNTEMSGLGNLQSLGEK